MTIKELLLFIAIMFAFTFVGWGIGVVSCRHNYPDGLLKLMELEERIEALEGMKVISSRKVIQVSVSAYNACPSQTDSTPFIMASGNRVYEGAVALSRDLERDFGLEFGDKVHLLGIGTFVFADRMHRRWKRRVDLFKWSKKKAIQFGRQKAIMVIRGG